MSTNDARPSIADLQKLIAVTPGPCESCNGDGCVGNRSEQCDDCAGTGNAAAVAMRRLFDAMPAVLRIVAAAIELDHELVYPHGPKSDRLKDALAMVRP